MNLASIIEPHPDDAVAILNRGRALTYGSLRAQVAGLRGGLTSMGVAPGDRVAIACANNTTFVVAYLAVLGVGATVVPLNPASPGPEIERELSAVRARAAVVGPAGQPAFEAVDRERVPSLEFVVTTGVGDDEHSLLDDLMRSDPVAVVEREPGDLAVLSFTSGTAGSPKAAMLTHGNLLANIEQVQAAPARGQRRDDVTLGVLPLFHVFGLTVVLGVSLRAGASAVLIERFDPTSALEAIVRHGVTVVPGAPAMWAAWAALPSTPTGTGEGDPFATVRIAASGSAKLPTEVAEAIERRFGLVVAEGYGLTEASPVVTSAAGIEPVKHGSIGLPLPGVDVRIVDAAGDDVLLGDPGEIWVRGPNVFAGYWEDTEATERALTHDGWLRTGDVAVVDDDGYLFIVDRAKDLIIVSGFNVFPAEVEEVLALHPAISAAAVVGVPHPHTGEAVKAYVVVRDGSNVEEDDVIAFCTRHLARYKCPAKVMFVDELPVNATGKVIRRALR
jgi:long-chain acyl-CoA synthetase